MIDRRHLMLGTGAGLVAGLTGCTTSGPSRELRLAYDTRTDGGFTLPAVPVQKVHERYRRQRVPYASEYRAGTVIVSTPDKLLWLVEPEGTAMRYGIGVGKEGFAWGGKARIGWKREWPTWTPPEPMIRREPELAEWRKGMPGGLGNPLGARALYLMRGGKPTLYRIHGSPEWWSIGTHASSGCIRLMNHDIIDLYDRVQPGARVVVRQA